MNIVALMIAGLRRAIRRTAGIGVLVLIAAGLTGCVHQPGPAFTFVQWCDPQLGFGGYDQDVARFRQAAQQINDLHPDFVVICGDLVNGASEKMFADFNALKNSLQVPCYCAPGNHDLGNAPTAASLERYRQWVGKDYFSFPHKGCLFVVVNSQLWKTPVAGENEKQDAWLKQTLETAAKARQPSFVIDHYPPFEKQPDEEDNYYNLPKAKRQELLGLFQRCGVVAVLSGHTHKVIINQFQGMQLIASQTTSRNFDKQPYGLRLWHVRGRPPYQNEFVPLR